MSAIDALRHKIKYPRPRKLSDPYWDFTEDHLKEILATNDSDFEGIDYRNLFGPHLPAGTYEEVMYFLPLAFAYFAQPENESGAYEMLDAVVGFASDYAEYLKTDGLLEAVGNCFQECLQSWITTFTIIHYDKNGCYKKGWGLQYLDIVTRLELLSETIYEMRRYKTFAEVAGEFVSQLSQNESDPIKAAWFLAYAADEYLRDEQTPKMFKFKFDAIQLSILDHDRLKKAAQLVRSDPALYEMSPTYWRDTFEYLALQDAL
jgi:hypothetical protein